MSDRAWNFVIQWTVYLVVMGLLAGGVFLFVMYLTADRTPKRCYIEYSTMNSPHEYILYEELDWHPNNQLGRFINRNEAVEFARLNGCPLPGDDGEKHVEQTDRKR